MGHRHKPGTSNEPIEILDSDDECIIDLTQDDLISHQTPPILQQPATKKKDSPTPSAVDYRSHSHQPLELASHRFSFVEGEGTPPTVNEANTTTLLVSLPRRVLHTDDDDLRGEYQQLILEDDTDSEPSDVMDMSTRHRLRRVHERRSRTSDDTRFNIPTSSSTTLRKPSPELANARGQRTHGDPTNDEQAISSPLLSAMEEALQSIKREMGEDHASYVSSQLQDAVKRSNELQAGLPDFSDAIDPFADMPPFDERNATAQVEDPINALNEEMGDTGVEKSQIPERVPRYKHYITITRSFLVSDNHNLYFEPYLGHNVDDDEIATQRWLEKLRKLYEPQEDPQASRQREHISRLKEYLPRMLERLNLDREDVVSYIIDTDMVAIRPPKTPLARFLNAFNNIFDTEIGDVFPEYEKYLDAMKEVERGLEEPEVDPVEKLLQPHLLSCPVCHVYLCGIHGVYETDDSEDEGKDNIKKADERYADMNMTYGGMMHRQEEKSARSKPGTTDSFYKGKPCSSSCFTIKRRDKDGMPEWTTDESTYFQALFLGMQHEPRAACILAPLMRRPCYDVQNLVISLIRDPPKPTPNEPRKKEKLDWYDNKRKKIRVDLDWGKKTNTHLHHDNLQPEGCEHPGLSCYMAKDDCSCNRKRILCDKFCACPDDCYMKFTGCNCSQGGSPCSQESLICPCKLLNRECDPDLCHNCGATETANPFNRDQDPPPHSCCNTDIQRGVRKRLLVGESSHPGDIGFGAYIAEPIKRGEFIGEYVGEIISYPECERRSEIYNKLKVSFFFDLNHEVTMDGYRYGNLERFINHSKKNANCKPLVRLVNGEHRIGFFATKDLAAGVELFFDYGKDFIKKHGLKEMEDVSKERGGGSKKMRRASKGMKIVSKEMRDTLKGIGDFSSEENATIDDDGTMPAIVYSFPDDGEAEEYVEDPDDVRKPSRRPRRNVVKPKKYTR